jgi:2-phosphosulfolactate phosphatase
MKIIVTFTPADFQSVLFRNNICVVIDVLRASSSIATAIANGARWIHPVTTPEEAFQLRETQTGSILLCGERDGHIIPGFDLGNSPEDYCNVQGKRLIFCSTNGSKLLVRAASCKMVFVGGFINASPVINILSAMQSDCVLCCAGREGGFSLEDTVCAGLFVRGILSSATEPVELSDSAIAAEKIFSHYADDLEGMLRTSFHGQYLIRLGYDRDLVYCARETIGILPVFEKDKIKKAKLP